MVSWVISIYNELKNDISPKKREGNDRGFTYTEQSDETG